MQESSEVKIAKFKKNLGMKFGPQKGTNIFDLVGKRLLLWCMSVYEVVVITAIFFLHLLDDQEKRCGDSDGAA